jgi:predicted acylesterase/phospholipase RssA
MFRFRWTVWLGNAAGGLAFAAILWLYLTDAEFQEWAREFDREWFPFQRRRDRGTMALVLPALAAGLIGGAVGFVIDLVKLGRERR